ncbi:MAG TPA: M23 family metallopeptidase [Geobacteraceae bacterium]|nr:M23 family metallopeptidase [Geobacteraceae bacterium]
MLISSASTPRKKLAAILLLAFIFLPTSVLAARQSPVDGGVITSGKGWRLDPFGSGRMVYHSGYDISVPIGTPVHPTESGTVFFAGPFHGYGNLVAVDHGNGYLTYYGHNSELLVKPGDRVSTDSVIALSGNTGRSTGPHVHYEMRHIPGYEKLSPAPPVNAGADLAAGKGPALRADAPTAMGGEEGPGLLPDTSTD